MQHPLFPVPRTFDTNAVERASLEARYAARMVDAPNFGKWVSYVGNKTVPGLRLYRYKEAFSFRLVRHFLQRFARGDAKDFVFDPFSGMGTTAFVAMQEGYPSLGIDRLPLAVLAGQALANLTTLTPGVLWQTFKRLKPQVEHMPPADVAEDVRIMSLAFPPAMLERLRRWKAAIDTLEPPLHEVFLWLFFAILESCSYTAKDGQFLRLKRDKTLADPDEALAEKVRLAEEDVAYYAARRQTQRWGPLPLIWEGDARRLKEVAFPSPPTAVVTSPPYANRYDYTRTYALELCFHFVKNFDELRALRHSILRSHIESRLNKNEEGISPHPAVDEILEALRLKDLNNARIPIMLKSYFVDMKQVVAGLGAVMAPQGWVAMVVDNVRFEGEMVPVDLILSALAEEEGFQVHQIIVARYKGNSSQQMKKYGRVPVRESILIWQKK